MRMTLNEPGRHKNKPLRLRVLWYYGFLPQSKYIVGVITGDCKLTVGVNGCLYLCVSLPQTGNLSRLDADSHPDSWDRLQPLHLDTWIIRFNHCTPYKINKKYNFISKLGSRRLELWVWDTLYKVLWVLMQSRKELYKKQSIIKSHIYWNAMLPGYLRFDEPAIVIPSNLNKVKKYCTKAQSFVVLAFVQQESLTHHMGSTRLYIYSLRGVSHWKA